MAGFMLPNREIMQIVIAPQINVLLEPYTDATQLQEHKPIQREIPMVWVQDGADFRLDITLPNSSVLDVLFPEKLESLHVNGETIWEKSLVHPAIAPGIHLEMTPSGLRLTCTSKGVIHILAHNVGQDRENP
jgi:hypothetical protein